MGNLNPPEVTEGGEDETVIDDTPIDEDELLSGLDGLDDAKTSTFREENRDDKYSKRKRQLNELSTYGKLDDIKVEYVRRLFGHEYRIDPADGQNSKELISSLDITKNKLTLNGTDVAYIDTGGNFKMTKNKKTIASSTRFINLYEKALTEHMKRAKSVVEEETGGEASGVTTEDIFEDARDKIYQEDTVAGNNFKERVLGLHAKGKLTEQETRDLAGIPVAKGTPGERVKFLKIESKRLEKELETETDPERRQVMQEGKDLADRGIDNAKLEMGQQPETEEGKHRFREKIREDIRTKFERFRKWAKENLGVISAIAISIAGIITTVVVAGKKTIVGASKGLGAVGKALAGLEKSALPILVPILNLLSTILSWGAKGLAFLAQNLWIVAVLIAGAIYKYLQSRRKK